MIHLHLLNCMNFVIISKLILIIFKLHNKLGAIDIFISFIIYVLY